VKVKDEKLLLTMIFYKLIKLRQKTQIFKVSVQQDLKWLKPVNLISLALLCFYFIIKQISKYFQAYMNRTIQINSAPRAHDMPVVNIHTIFVKTFFPITLEWKIKISPKSIQTVRLSIPITVRSLKWIGQGVRFDQVKVKDEKLLLTMIFYNLIKLRQKTW
jgi:hypothetical protein